MSILTPAKVAPFLQIDVASDGLEEAIRQAENLVAAKMRIATLELTEYPDEQRILTYTTQQVLPRHGPVQELTAFTYEGDDHLSDVEIAHKGWAIKWSNPGRRRFDRVTSFERMSRVKYTYSAGWTDEEGSYPLPAQVEEYVKAMTGLTYMNLLLSGVYDTKLGDMTIKIQRETMQKDLELYDKALRVHGRPY